MGHLIDTSVLIAIERGALDVDRFQAGMRSGDVAMSVVTASELLHGAHRANTAQRRASRLSFIEGLLAQMPVLAYDLDVARLYARVWADLAVAGRLIGVHDMQIGATALHHKLTIATLNARDFARIDGLKIEIW